MNSILFLIFINQIKSTSLFEKFIREFLTSTLDKTKLSICQLLVPTNI